MFEYDFQDIKDSNERILISFKPSIFIALIRSLAGLFVGLFGIPLLFGGLLVRNIPFLGPEETTNFEPMLFLILISFGTVFLLAGGGLIIAPILIVLNTPRLMKKTIYALSDKRIITCTGKTGVDSKSIPYFSIETIDINVGFFDKLFGTGTLSFIGMGTETSTSNSELISLKGIKNPLSLQQDIMRELQLAQHPRAYE